MPRFNMSWIYLVIIIALAVIFFTDGGQTIGQGTVINASYSDFKTYVDKGYVKQIVVNKSESKMRLYINAANTRDVFHQSQQQTGANPCVDVVYGSIDQVEQFVEAERAAGKFKGQLKYEVETQRFHEPSDEHRATGILRFPVVLPYGTLRRRRRWRRHGHLQRRTLQGTDV